MKVLIIGGAGFIGSHLAEYHLSMNDTVVAVDNLSTGKAENIQGLEKNPYFSFFKSDLLLWQDLDEQVAKAELIYDLAAIVGMFNVLKHPVDTLHVNINITEKILESMCRLDKKPRILVASSSEVYGSQKTAMKESDSLLIEATNKAHASYPVSKLCNEIQAMAYQTEKDLPVTVVRIFNTVGPRQSSRYGMVLPRFVKQALKGEDLTVFGDGHQIRSFCDVRDLCNIFYQLMHNEQSIGQIINCGNDAAISILNLAKKVIDLTQSSSKPSFQDIETVYGKGYIDIEERRPDLDKLKSMIAFSPKWTLEATILDMARSMS